MSERRHDDDGATGARLVAGILAIVLVGAALGITYNALQQQANPSRALAWVRSDAPLKSFEDLQAGAPAAAAIEIPPAAPAPDEAPAAPAPEPGQRPATAAILPQAQKPVPEVVSRPATGPVTGPVEKPAASAATPPAPATPAPAPATAAPLPVIPDLREPLEIKLATVKQFYDAGAAVIVDARSTEEFAEGHVRGAVSLPFDDVARDPARLKRFDAGGRPVIVYCGGGECELSKDLASLLIDAGQRKVLVYTAGYPEWVGAGYPTAQGAAGGAQ